MTDWVAQYSDNVSLKQVPNTVFLFKFPTTDGVHYIVKETDGIKSAKLSMTFEIKGNSPVFTAPGDPPARVRLYFQREGDNMSGQGSMQFYRWWSNPIAQDLSVGKHTLVVPLTPTNWSSVYGKNGTANLQAFHDAISHAKYVGMTFGSASQFGHGAWLSSGSAKFKLLQFQY